MPHRFVSLALITTKLGMRFAQFGPKGYQLSADRQAKLDGFVKFLVALISLQKMKLRRGLADADFVYTDVWYGSI